jgi:hypothetical protein
MAVSDQLEMLAVVVPKVTLLEPWVAPNPDPAMTVCSPGHASRGVVPVTCTQPTAARSKIGKAMRRARATGVIEAPDGLEGRVSGASGGYARARAQPDY